MHEFLSGLHAGEESRHDALLSMFVESNMWYCRGRLLSLHVRLADMRRCYKYFHIC